MSWTSIRPYFNARLESLGLMEWTDGFNFSNIPSDILSGAYHVEIGDFVGESLNQRDQVSRVRVIVRVFRKGFYNPQSAIDEAIAENESIVKTCLNPSNRLTQPFKNVSFVSSTVRALDPTNDNACVSELEFDVLSILDVE